MPQSGQLLVFLPEDVSEKSDKAGEDGAEDSTEAEGERAGEDALEDERLRSTGWVWGWLLQRARMA